MSKYLKLFETTSQYETYIKGSDVVLPNVSVAKDAPTTVYFNPLPFFAKLSLNNGEVVELQGSGELTYEMVSDQYETSVVRAEIGKLCTSIGESAFENCSGLTNITIPSSVTSIGEWAFGSCDSLTDITIPSSVTSISGSAFGWCSSLTSIVVDSANTAYDSRNNCNAIIDTSTNELIAGCKNTVIPNTVTSIGVNAFVGCSGLTSITIPDSVTNIGEYAFQSCSGVTSITIPDSVTSIGFQSFYDCTGLTSITIGSGVTSIGVNAFNGCTGLTSVTIPNSVTSIGGNAFMICTGLTSVTIGSGVTSIGNNAFGNCSSLTSITSLAATAPTIQSNTFYMVKTGGTLTVPNRSTGYDVWMGTGNYYLGKYNWTKVEK